MSLSFLATLAAPAITAPLHSWWSVETEPSESAWLPATYDLQPATLTGTDTADDASITRYAGPDGAFCVVRRSAGGSSSSELLLPLASPALVQSVALHCHQQAGQPQLVDLSVLPWLDASINLGWLSLALEPTHSGDATSALNSCVSTFQVLRSVSCIRLRFDGDILELINAYVDLPDSNKQDYTVRIVGITSVVEVGSR